MTDWRWRDRLVGCVDEIDDYTVYLKFAYDNDPLLRVCKN